jgi:hypothetical protein
MPHESIALLISEIQRSEDEKTTVLQRYAERICELKTELAKVCGHRVVRHFWIWATCVDCGFTDLAAAPGFKSSKQAR